MARHLGTALAFASLLQAREIVFPPTSGYQQPLRGNSFGALEYETDDISEPLYNGLNTFANLAYVHCLANSTLSGEDVEKYDIAVLGAPFDTGVTARPGARFGPGVTVWRSSIENRCSRGEYEVLSLTGIARGTS